MKKCILIFMMLILLPVALPAKIIYSDKCELLEKAKQSKRNALRLLHEVEDDEWWFIPDLEKRDNMKTLIGSCITAGTVKDAKNKLVAVGLQIIASLAIDAYELGSERLLKIADAAHHFEMAEFYRSLSLGVNHCNRTDRKETPDLATERLFDAIDYLTICDMYASCIDDEWVRDHISESIVNERDYLVKIYQEDNNVTSRKMSEHLEEFYENLPEILLENSNEYINKIITDYVEETLQALRNAESFWRVK